MSYGETYANALAALDTTSRAFIALMRGDLAKHGVMHAHTQVDSRPIENTREVKVGDLVQIYGHQRYRAARVWKVGAKNVSAYYLTPTQLDAFARYGHAICPTHITGRPVAWLDDDTAED